jgi:three-Cys-motif partner protein
MPVTFLVSGHLVSQNRSHFDEFAAHTLLKHAILHAYLEAWARKLLLRPGAGRVVWYVDANAGEGMDELGNEGSPVLAARIAQRAEAQLREMRGESVEVRTIFFEVDERRTEALKTNLSAFGSRAEVIQGSIVDHLDKLLERTGDDPVLLFSDPFGLQQDATVIQRVLHASHNEVFALFADQAALRHFGALVTADPDLEQELQQLIPTLFDDLNAEQEADVRSRVEKRTRALVGTKAAAVRILDAAYHGHAWYDQVCAVPESQRRAKFLALYESMLRGFGATHVLSLPVRNQRNHHVYHLVHATKSAAGYMAMKEAIEAALKRAQLTGEAVEKMRFLIRSDLASVERAIRAKFAGQSVRWSDAGDRSVPSVRRFALQSTSAFPSELDLLKARLAELRAPGRAILYRFPHE